LPRAAERACQCFREHGLADTGHIFEEQVPFCDQGYERQPDDVVFALDDLLDIARDALEQHLELGEVRGATTAVVGSHAIPLVRR
jgi:hypothetical protein